MSAPFNLQPLLELMQERSDEATRQLGHLIAAEQNEQERLKMLEDYRSEYANGLISAASQGLTAVAIRNYRDFLMRIDDAIVQQRQNVDRSKNNTATGQAHWRAQNTKLKAMSTLSERHEEKEQKKENRREQKIQDEFSSRRFAVSAQEATDN